MRPSSSVSVAIVGAGYTSAALVRICLTEAGCCEKIAVFGKGLLVMVRLSVLCTRLQTECAGPDYAASPCKPDLFPIWAEACLQDEGAYCEAGQFYRRADFARYMDHELGQLPHNEDVNFIRQQVISCAL